MELAEASDNHQAPTHGHQQNIRAFLGGLFGQLCTGQGHLSQTGLLQKPWLVATAARLIGDYALWFSTLGGPEVPLEGALRLLLTTLKMPQVQYATSWSPARWKAVAAHHAHIHQSHVAACACSTSCMQVCARGECHSFAGLPGLTYTEQKQHCKPLLSVLSRDLRELLC